MYKVVVNNHLDSFNKRNSFLPSSSWKEVKTNAVTFLGRFHTTSQFSVHPDGSLVITFNNDDANDTFTVTIQMVRITCIFDLRRQHWAYAQISHGSTHTNAKFCSKQLAFTIAIGDIFKHYHKNTKSTTVAIKKKKKSGRNVQDEDDINDENEDAYINEFVAKSMKIQLYNTDVRAIIGSIESWDKHDLRLWDVLLDQGFLSTIGSDFVSFCNSFLILPMYYYNAADSLSDCLTKLSSHKMVKKLVRYFLSGEDPSAKMWAQIPKREFFAAKPLAVVLEENSKDLMERYENFRLIKVMKYLVKELNTGNKEDLKENYPPMVYEDIQAVGSAYPLHALRSIHLTSWCSTDFEVVNGMVASAESIAKCQRLKHLINKRGKFQKYNHYDGLIVGRCKCSYCEGYDKRNNKYDVMKRELAFN